VPDLYKSFAELHANEKEGSDFRVRARKHFGTTAVIAPHGGGIEPGTSELADAIADTDFSFYTFEGLKKRGNGVLHITSSHFDEPSGLVIVGCSPRVVALHGEQGCRGEVVFLGGLDSDLAKRIEMELASEGFSVKAHSNPNLQGVDRGNICNRGQKGRGVQLELSRPFRNACFFSLDSYGRQELTVTGNAFVRSMRRALFTSL